MGSAFVISWSGMGSSPVWPNVSHSHTGTSSNSSKSSWGDKSTSPICTIEVIKIIAALDFTLIIVEVVWPEIGPK